ncbi:PRC-barrel domain-containing protein [Thermithiobacillus plumbiphilus]|uniref:PRC-barrel domain-containing protein n=1 Tax=Thermithiobacillus plumbiphilus TaxID=1729899 RepID=A0ABU9D805_9PROT
MRKGHSIIGLKVISQPDGETLGSVRDLVFDHDADRLVALVLSDRELFGMIKAHVVPWEALITIGPDAVMVRDDHASIVVDERPEIRKLMEGAGALSGKRVFTTDGRDLGTLGDMYIDEASGNIVGYEVSGGVVNDAMAGKRFLAVEHGMRLGEDVALVPPEAADALTAQAESQPGGLRGAAATAQERLGTAAEGARTRAAGIYENISEASVEKQREFVLGRTAGRDVFIPATQGLPDTIDLSAASASTQHDLDSVEASSLDDSEAPETLLVRKGEIITEEQIERAEAAGRLRQLVLAAGGGAVSAAWSSGRERISGLAASGTSSTAEAVVGKTAGREVLLPSGATLVAPGMIITPEILQEARLHGRERELIAAAGSGMASQGMQATREKAGNFWETVKEKAAELTAAMHAKRAEYAAKQEQQRINDALGRPTTRVILDRADNVILNTGEIITHAAVERARAAGVLSVLLDSAYKGDPGISPEMTRADSSGEAALDQENPHPITPPAGERPGQQPTLR